MDWQLLIAVVALGSSALMFFSNILDKSLSIREHEEYKSHVTRELDSILDRIKVVETTRPTTGELEARFDRNGLHLNK